MYLAFQYPADERLLELFPQQKIVTDEELMESFCASMKASVRAHEAYLRDKAKLGNLIVKT